MSLVHAPRVPPTLVSDLNELSVAYCLAGQRWSHPAMRATFRARVRALHDLDAAALVYVHVTRGQYMATALTACLGGASVVSAAFWVGRGDGTDYYPSLSPDHPADVLLRWTGNNGWFGISCKSTDRAGGTVGLKNPGLVPVCRALGTTVDDLVAPTIADAIRRWSLPATQDARKAAIRTNPGVAAWTRTQGRVLLTEIRGRLLDAALRLSSPHLGTFVRTTCLNAAPEIDPAYLIVTGYGTVRGAYGAHVSNPLQTYPEPWSVSPYGTDALLFRAGAVTVCKLRVKWESEPLASTLKCSVDPP